MGRGLPLPLSPIRQGAWSTDRVFWALTYYHPDVYSLFGISFPVGKRNAWQRKAKRGRDALSKCAGGAFVAKAGRELVPDQDDALGGLPFPRVGSAALIAPELE